MATSRNVGKAKVYSRYNMQIHGHMNVLKSFKTLGVACGGGSRETFQG